MFAIPDPSTIKNLEQLLNLFFGLIRPLFIVTFAGVILYGAWVWMTSKGDSEKIVKARRIIIAAIVGFALAVIAPSIANVIGGFLGVQF